MEKLDAPKEYLHPDFIILCLTVDQVWRVPEERDVDCLITSAAISRRKQGVKNSSISHNSVNRDLDSIKTRE